MNSTFDRNSANGCNGGAMYLHSNSSINCGQCNFNGNDASKKGSVVFVSPNSEFVQSDHNAFTLNKSSNGDDIIFQK